MRFKNAAFAASLTALMFTPALAAADTVQDWNALAVTLTNGQGAFRQARSLAIVQLAVFEAVNVVNGNPYQPYLGTLISPVGASAEAAAAQAAHDALLVIAPGNAATLDAALAASLGGIADPARSNGITVGAAAATAMLANRANDGSSPLLTSTPSSSDPGVWQLTPTCTAGLFYNWQNVTPFGVANTAAFLLPPPPALTSNLYLKDWAEVKTVGASDSTARPADRAHIAGFFATASPGFVFSSVARQLGTARGDSLVYNARALALINMAINDSLIASFFNKYHYQLWRPVTAIHDGDLDGNDKTIGDPAFLPFITTPCFPSYPSNHASGSTGGAEAIRRLYGAAGHEIVLVHPTNPALGSLSYSSLEQITHDVDDARVYGGIHFRFDQVAGGDLGRTIATEVVKNNLQKVPQP